MSNTVLLCIELLVTVLAIHNIGWIMGLQVASQSPLTGIAFVTVIFWAGKFLGFGVMFLLVGSVSRVVSKEFVADGTFIWSAFHMPGSDV